MTWTQTNAITQGGKITPGWVAEIKSNIAEAASYNGTDTTQLKYSNMSASTSASAISKNYIIAYQDINSISEARPCSTDKGAHYSSKHTPYLSANNANNNSGNLSSNDSSALASHDRSYYNSHYEYCTTELDSVDTAYCYQEKATHDADYYYVHFTVRG